MNIKKIKIIYDVALYILGSISLLFVMSLLAFYFHAAYILGHLPSYNNPDPKELGIYTFYDNTLTVTMITWSYSVFAWLFIMATYPLVNKFKNYNPVKFSAIAYILSFILFFSGILEWYAD